MEVQLKGAFIGAVTRKYTKDGVEKEFADLHASVAMRQAPGAVGQDVRTFRMDPALFTKLRNVPLYSPITIICEEDEYTRQGGTTETVKRVVEVVPELQKKAA